MALTLRQRHGKVNPSSSQALHGSTGPWGSESNFFSNEFPWAFPALRDSRVQFGVTLPVLPPWATAAVLKRCGPGDRQFNIGLFVRTKVAEWLIPLVEIRASGGCPWVSVSICTKKLKQALGAVPPHPSISSGNRGEWGCPEKAGRCAGGALGSSSPALLALVGAPSRSCPRAGAGLGHLTHCGSLSAPGDLSGQAARAAAHTKPPRAASWGGPLPQGRASPLSRAAGGRQSSPPSKCTSLLGTRC